MSINPYNFWGKKSGLHLPTITKNLIFNLELQNQITETIQLLKLCKFGPLGGLEGGFPFCVN